MEHETSGKRGRKAQPVVLREFQIVLNKADGDYSDRKYQKVEAANFADAGKMADGLARVLRLNVVEIEVF